MCSWPGTVHHRFSKLRTQVWIICVGINCHSLSHSTDSSNDPASYICMNTLPCVLEINNQRAVSLIGCLDTETGALGEGSSIATKERHSYNYSGKSVLPWVGKEGKSSSQYNYGV